MASALDLYLTSLAQGQGPAPASLPGMAAGHVLPTMAAPGYGYPQPPQAPLAGIAPQFADPMAAAHVAPPVAPEDPAAQAAGLAPEGGNRALAAMLLGQQLPGLGATIGRAFDTLSDERAKSQIEPADTSVDRFLDALGG